jgi:glutamate carboxypeptidase
MKTPSPSILAVALGFACATTAVAVPDEKLKTAAEAAQPALIDTLHEMVLIESGSGDIEGLKKMAHFTEARLRALGAKTERRKTTHGAGADMVIGTFEGSGSKKLMLISHMDTVYQKGVLATQPYRVDGNRIYGPGIADDKGGLAVILHSLKIPTAEQENAADDARAVATMTAIAAKNLRSARDFVSDRRASERYCSYRIAIKR